MTVPPSKVGLSFGGGYGLLSTHPVIETLIYADLPCCFTRLCVLALDLQVTGGIID